MNFYSFILTLTLILASAGCASLRGTKQVVKLTTNVESAEVYDDKKSLGAIPAFVSLPRGKSQTLVVQHEGTTKEISLQSNYRWIDSFLTNALVGVVLNPWIGGSGLALDLILGSAWNYETPEPILFSEPGKRPSLKPEVIAILPPIYHDELVSDEVARLVLEELRSKYPDTKLVEPHINLQTFLSFRVSHQGGVPIERREELFYKLGVSHVADARVEDTEAGLKIKVSIYDVFRDRIDARHDLKLPRGQVRSYSTGWKKSVRSAVIGFLPNSLGLQRSYTNFFWWKFNSTEHIVVESADNGLGSLNGWGLTFGNIPYDAPDVALGLLFRWTPHFTLIYQKVRSERFILASRTTQDWSWWSAGAGLGPEVGLKWAFGYTYSNFSPLWSYHHFSNSAKSSMGSLGYVVEVGHGLYLSDRFGLRLYTQIHSVSDLVVNTAFETAGSTTNDAPAAKPHLTRTGISLEYIFPEFRRGVKTLLNH